MVQNSFLGGFFNGSWKYGLKGDEFENLEKLDISWTSWSLGLTWTSELGVRLDGTVNSWVCRKKLKTWCKILSWVKIKVYDGRFDSWAWKV